MVELLNPLYIIINIFVLIFTTINNLMICSVLCLCGGRGVIPPFAVCVRWMVHESSQLSCVYD